MKKLNLDSDLVTIIKNYLFFKVAIKSLDKVYNIPQIHQRLIHCVQRKERGVPLIMLSEKIDFLNTHIVQSLAETSLMSQDFLK